MYLKIRLKISLKTLEKRSLGIKIRELYAINFSSWEIKASTGLQPMTSAIRVHRSI